MRHAHPRLSPYREHVAGRERVLVQTLHGDVRPHLPDTQFVSVEVFLTHNKHLARTERMGVAVADQAATSDHRH